MKFAHIADCHIGGWRDPKLRQLTIEAFEKSVRLCIEHKVDFVLISGDLFNTALPGIDMLKEVVKNFKNLRSQDIHIYIIPGSHDFSPSGKTMLDVLEEAELCTNVVKGKVKDNKLKLEFTVDKKTGAKITGMLGRRGMLEKSYYEDLDRDHLETEAGFKIFMFHTSLTELKPKKFEKMESSPVSFLPKGFDYYAGGHVHIVKCQSFSGYKNVVYPGPLFPNSFSELEELKGGGFYIYDDGKIIRQNITIKNIISADFDAEHKIPEQLNQEMLDFCKNKEFYDSIVMIRVQGRLESGTIAQIDFRKIYDVLHEKSAYYVLRNTTKLSSQEFSEIKVQPKPAEEVEETLINQHTGQIAVTGWDANTEKDMIKRIMTTLASQKKEGEKVYQFESRIKEEVEKVLKI